MVQEDEIMLFDGEECTGDFITVRATGVTLQYEAGWFLTESAKYGKGSWANRTFSMRLPRQVTILLY